MSKDEFDIVCQKMNLILFVIWIVVEKGDAGNVNQSGSKAGTETENDINTTNSTKQTEDEGGILTQEGNGSQNAKKITKKSPKKKSK